MSMNDYFANILRADDTELALKSEDILVNFDCLRLTPGSQVTHIFHWGPCQVLSSTSGF